MESKKRKGAGGAEKIRAKKKLALQADAAKCAKISQLFGGYSGASTSVKLASDGGQQPQVEEGKGRQEEERPEAAAGPSGRTELEVSKTK